MLQGRQRFREGRQLGSGAKVLQAAGCLLSKSKYVNEIYIAHTEC